ncbi:hypothetical protein RRG08_059827 [Elysia crispata]|uniref:Uncharacterized protein n=1 Tax=Elysia crispata TaxID=231223 RepID=A0AAE0ZCJ9_9GAST|nr:hypothetical protein RRG08_059827 [Elysia crispata]
MARNQDVIVAGTEKGACGEVKGLDATDKLPDLDSRDLYVTGSESGSLEVRLKCAPKVNASRLVRFTPYWFTKEQDMKAVRLESHVTQDCRAFLYLLTYGPY